jgi:hypothetical protein
MDSFHHFGRLAETDSKFSLCLLVSCLALTLKMEIMCSSKTHALCELHGITIHCCENHKPQENIQDDLLKCDL